MTRRPLHRVRSAALAGSTSALLVLGMAVPANAVVSVFGNYVQGDGADDNISVSCVAGVLSASGVTGDPCATLTSLSVYPDGGTDSVDLAAVTAAAFPALVSTSVSTSDTFADTVQGSPVSDVLDGDSLDTLNGNAGNDQLTGGGSVSGGLGDDTIIEFNGAGIASGGPGDDRFVQFIPQAGIEGGSGFDSWDVDFDQASPVAGADLSVTLTADQVHIILGPTDLTVPVGGLEQAYWTLLRGDVQTFDATSFPGALNLRGMAGTDHLIGGVADDALYGGGGDDTLTGNAGSDLLRGGDGNDTISARDGMADRVDCGEGTDAVVADLSDLVVGCESVDLPAVPPLQPPPPAQAAPETSAIQGKSKVSKPRKAKFAFSSTTPGATFQCKLDKGRWKTCSSPHKVKTKKLKTGKHTLRVRAVAGGLVDATPSKKTFKVKRRRR